MCQKEPSPNTNFEMTAMLTSDYRVILRELGQYTTSVTVCKNHTCLNISRMPWRSPDTVTAGMIRIALLRIIPRLTMREGGDRYRQTYEFNLAELIDQSVFGKAKATLIKASRQSLEIRPILNKRFRL